MSESPLDDEVSDLWFCVGLNLLTRSLTIYGAGPTREAAMAQAVGRSGDDYLTPFRMTTPDLRQEVGRLARWANERGVPRTEVNAVIPVFMQTVRQLLLDGPPSPPTPEAS